MNLWRVCLFAAISFHSVLAAEPEHPLDRKVNALMDKALSTADQIAAADKAWKLWDAELNRVYQQLRKSLNPTASEALQAAQRTWLAHRDAQWKFIDAYYDEFEGTMYQPMRVQAKADVIRARVLELQRHLDGLKER